MSESASLIMTQFLAWVADRPRTYTQTMEAWRSTCPRLSVWEDASIEGLVCIGNDGNRAVRVGDPGSLEGGPYRLGNGFIRSLALRKRRR